MDVQDYGGVSDILRVNATVFLSGRKAAEATAAYMTTPNIEGLLIFCGREIQFSEVVFTYQNRVSR